LTISVDRIRLHPATHQPAGFVERTGGVLVTAFIEIVHLHGEAEKEAQLLQPQIGAGEMAPALARVGRLDQRLQHVERGLLNAVAEQELLIAREILERGHEPEQKLKMRLDGWAGLAGLVVHRGFAVVQASSLRSGREDARNSLSPGGEGRSSFPLSPWGPLGRGGLGTTASPTTDAMHSLSPVLRNGGERAKSQRSTRP